MNLSKLSGVKDCRVSYKDGTARVIFARGVEPDVEKIKHKIREPGYTPGDATLTH